MSACNPLSHGEGWPRIDAAPRGFPCVQCLPRCSSRPCRCRGKCPTPVGDPEPPLVHSEVMRESPTAVALDHGTPHGPARLVAAMTFSLSLSGSLTPHTRRNGRVASAETAVTSMAQRPPGLHVRSKQAPALLYARASHPEGLGLLSSRSREVLWRSSTARHDRKHVAGGNAPRQAGCISLRMGRELHTAMCFACAYAAGLVLHAGECAQQRSVVPMPK